MIGFHEIEQRRQQALITGLLLGFLIGGVAAAMLTPASGAQMRELLREQGLGLKDRFSDQATRIRRFAAQ